MAAGGIAAILSVALGALGGGYLTGRATAEQQARQKELKEKESQRKAFEKVIEDAAESGDVATIERLGGRASEAYGYDDVLLQTQRSRAVGRRTVMEAQGFGGFLPPSGEPPSTPEAAVAQAGVPNAPPPSSQPGQPDMAQALTNLLASQDEQRTSVGPELRDRAALGTQFGETSTQVAARTAPARAAAAGVSATPQVREAPTQPPPGTAPAPVPGTPTGFPPPAAGTPPPQLTVPPLRASGSATMTFGNLSKTIQQPGIDSKQATAAAIADAQGKVSGPALRRALQEAALTSVDANRKNPNISIFVPDWDQVKEAERAGWVGAFEENLRAIESDYIPTGDPNQDALQFEKSKRLAARATELTHGLAPEGYRDLSTLSATERTRLIEGDVTHRVKDSITTALTRLQGLQKGTVPRNVIPFGIVADEIDNMGLPPNEALAAKHQAAEALKTKWEQLLPTLEPGKPFTVYPIEAMQLAGAAVRGAVPDAWKEAVRADPKAFGLEGHDLAVFLTEGLNPFDAADWQKAKHIAASDLDRGEIKKRELQLIQTQEGLQEYERQLREPSQTGLAAVGAAEQRGRIKQETAQVETRVRVEHETAERVASESIIPSLQQVYQAAAELVKAGPLATVAAKANYQELVKAYRSLIAKGVLKNTGTLQELEQVSAEQYVPDVNDLLNPIYKVNAGKKLARAEEILGKALGRDVILYDDRTVFKGAPRQHKLGDFYMDPATGTLKRTAPATPSQTGPASQTPSTRPGKATREIPAGAYQELLGYRAQGFDPHDRQALQRFEAGEKGWTIDAVLKDIRRNHAERGKAD